MKSDTSVKKTVWRLLYAANPTGKSLDYGVLMEKVAISCFEKEKNKVVRESGIFVDPENLWLAASPG